MSDEVETPIKRIKQEFSDDEHIEPPSFSPATLGLHRVGTILPPKPQPTQPIQSLNARGMPARIRKRNRLFFDDELVNDQRSLRMSLSPRKSLSSSKNSSPTKTPTKVLRKRKGVASRYMRSSEKEKNHYADTATSKLSPTSSKDLPSGGENSSSRSKQHNVLVIPVDKKVTQKITLRLKNLLKLPKAHKWVIFEWFYSFIDQALFNVDNDFQSFLSVSFPKLKTRQLTRCEWHKVRSVMGRPRRCSQAFFEEERRELERKRQKIRYVQTQKSVDIKDLNYVRDLPNKIPLPLPVGTKVTARLRVPQDGVFTGSVDAFDSMSSTYRITFERHGLGTHSIPDFEIVSDNFHEMLPINSLTHEFRPGRINMQRKILLTTPLKNIRNALNLNRSDPLLGQEVFESPFKNPVIEKETIGGFSVKLLETIVRLKRALSIKKTKLQRLSDMNSEAELKIPLEGTTVPNTKLGPSPLTEEFQRRYASIVISMEKMNRDMQDYLNEIQNFSSDLTRDSQVQAMLAPSFLREKCREAADDAVQRNNQDTIQDKSVLKLIKNLATVLLVASHLSSDTNSQVTKVLEGCIEEVKSGLGNAVNIEVFQKHVQIHLHHIRLGIGQSMMSAANSTAAIDR